MILQEICTLSKLTFASEFMSGMNIKPQKKIKKKIGRPIPMYSTKLWPLRHHRPDSLPTGQYTQQAQALLLRL